jgi:hypothetical protein
MRGPGVQEEGRALQKEVACGQAAGVADMPPGGRACTPCKRRVRRGSIKSNERSPQDRPVPSVLAPISRPTAEAGDWGGPWGQLSSGYRPEC